MTSAMSSHRSSSSSTSPNNAKRPRTAESGPSKSPMTGPRITQRAPQSCLECTRRKIKCDKEQPCKACIGRGEAASCRREAVLVKGAVLSGPGPERTVSLQSLSQQVEELKRRVAHLEGERMDSHVPEDIETGIYSRAHSPHHHRGEFDQGRLPSAMEEAALGIGESTRWMGSSMLTQTEKDPLPNPWYQPQSFEYNLSLLPTQAQARVFVSFYLDNVSWITGVIHAPSFWSEFADFWTKLERAQARDDIWLALLLSVLSIGAYFMDEQQAHIRGLEGTQHLALTWFNAAVATVLRCNLLTDPTLTLCQVIQVLGPGYHLSRNTRLHQSFTPIGRGYAKELNLHLLGESHGTSDLEIRKEVGRRVHWNDLESGWAFLPYNRWTSYIPHHYSTALPKAFPGEPGGLLYREMCFRSSRLLYDVYGPIGPLEDPPYERVLAASNAMLALREGLAQHTGSPHLTPLEVTQNRLIHMTLAYRSYQIHRLFYIKSLTTDKYSSSKTACLAAAETILTVADAGLPPIFYLMWNVAVMMVAAGLVMALELIHGTWEDRRLNERRTTLHRLIDRLRGLQDQSGIATRGAALIDHLLIMDTQLRSGQRSDIKLTREAILDIVQGPKPSPTDFMTQPQLVSMPYSTDNAQSVGLKDLKSQAVSSSGPQMDYSGTELHPQTIPFGAELDLALLWDDFFATS